MIFTNGKLRNSIAAMATGVLAVGIPATGMAEWPFARGDAARSNFYAGPNPVAPSVTQLGDYGFQGVAALFASLVVSEDHIFYLSELGITAIERNPDRQATDPYILDGEEWTYGQSFNFDPNVMRTMRGEFVLHEGTLTFSEGAITNPGAEQTFSASIVALNQNTGNESWRFTINNSANLGMTMIGDNVFIRHRPQDQAQSATPTRITRVPFGAGSSTHSAELAFVDSTLEMIASPEAGLVISEEDRNIIALRANDLSRAWTFTIPQDQGTVSIREMIVVGTDVVAILNDDTLLSINSAGQENWRVPVPEVEGDCQGSGSVLASDSEVIVLAGFCSDVLYGFRASDGNAQWNTTTPFYNRQSVPLITGGAVYLPVITDIFANQPGLAAYGIENGNELQVLETEGIAPHFHLGASNGVIFAVGNGIAPLARVITYRSTAGPVDPESGSDAWAIH